MAIFNRKYDLSRDVASLRKRLSQIMQLRELTHHPAWKQVRVEFEKEIASLTQGYMDLCDNPKKNEVEIRCKRMVSIELARILCSIDATIKSGDGLSEEIKQRSNN